MDKEVEDRFKETFHAVQSHFSDVFKQLFGGGQAELQLTEDDYLAAGVDIIVQPQVKTTTFIFIKWWRARIKCNCFIICYIKSKISTIYYIR